MAGNGNGGQPSDAPAPAPASPLPGGRVPVAADVGVQEDVQQEEENPALPAHGAGLGGGVPVPVGVVVHEEVPQDPAPAAQDAADVGLLEALVPEDEDDTPPTPDQEDGGVVNQDLQDLQDKLDAPEPDVTGHQVEGSSFMRELEKVLAPGPAHKKQRTDNILPPPPGQVAVGGTAAAIQFVPNHVPAVGGGPGGVLMAAGMGPGVASNPGAQFASIPRPPNLSQLPLCPGCNIRPPVINIVGRSMLPPAVLPPHPCLCNPCFYGAPDRREIDCPVCAEYYGLYPWRSRRV
ncbi:uncharacterized protein [Aegilops tauschii subsp. strangulata]|uniref:uncharacterized protein n=1 Tax=Aegilops tauschii subsp. strangulata TaxID=200361 RepID=UPI001ABCCC7E|nr:uncharacterized protein LOC120974443 [Aegilops tauschii subsp. strangulata]XP_044327847.1 uncharacterized protein LOC123048886 [Triticum aestivum]